MMTTKVEIEKRAAVTLTRRRLRLGSADCLETPGGSSGGRSGPLAHWENVRLRTGCMFSLKKKNNSGEPPSWPGKGGGRKTAIRR